MASFEGSASVSIDEKTRSFLKWLDDNGAKFPKLLFPSTDTVSGMRGTIALETIETDEVMMEIPAKLMMSEVNALNDPEIGTVLGRNSDIMSGDTLLALYIMKEYLLGEASFYWPYLAILPPPGTVSEWSLEELRELQDESVSLRARDRKGAMLRLYALRVQQLSNRHPDVFPAEKYTLELFLFAYNSVIARAFGRRLPWSAMVPFADCLNHSNVQNKYDFDVDDNGMFRMYPSGKNKYLMGSEVFNSYGRRSNLNLLLDYGFALLDNEWDEVEFTIPINTEEPLFARRAMLIHAAGFHCHNYKHLVQKQFLPVEALGFARFLSLSEEEIHEYSDKVDKDMELFRKQCEEERSKECSIDSNSSSFIGKRRELSKGRRNTIVSVQSELSAVQVVRQRLISSRVESTTNLIDDEKMLGELKQRSTVNDGGDDDVGRLMSALHYRISKKRILESTINKLRVIENFLTDILAQKEETVMDPNSLANSLRELSFIPQQPGIFCNLSCYVDDVANVSRVGLHNDLTMQTRRTRKLLEDKYMMELISVCTSYVDKVMCSQEETT